MSSPTILLADRDRDMRAFLAEQLTADGYRTLLAASGEQALALASRHAPQLLVADLNGHTLALLDALRAGRSPDPVDPDTPMIVLSEHADELTRVRVFDRGGDDVVAKPFSYPELRGRIRALLRRAYSTHRAPITEIGSLRIDHHARCAWVGERSIALTHKEFELLHTLAGDPMRVFGRRELLRDVWGYRTPSRTVDTHLLRLRTKVRDAGGDRRLLRTIRGVGYRLCGPGMAG